MSLAHIVSGFLALLLALAGFAGSAAAQADDDGDGVPNSADNCISVANPSQLDTNLDGYGNACDADYNNDGVVGAPDYLILSRAMGSHPGDANWNPDVDCDGNNVIDNADYTCFSTTFGQNFAQTQPSGRTCAGHFPCPCNASVGAFCPCEQTPTCLNATGIFFTPTTPDCSYTPSANLNLPSPSCPVPDAAARVLVDTTHQETNRIVDPGVDPLTGTAPGTRYWPFAKLISADGVVAIETFSSLTASCPSGGCLLQLLKSTTTNVLVVSGENSALTDDEVTGVDNWVKAGHGLFMAPNWHAGNLEFEKLIRRFYCTINTSGPGGGGSIATGVPYRFSQSAAEGEGTLNTLSDAVCGPGRTQCPGVVFSYSQLPAVCPIPAADGSCPDQSAVSLNQMCNDQPVQLDRPIPMLKLPTASPSLGFLGDFAFCHGSGRVYISTSWPTQTRVFGAGTNVPSGLAAQYQGVTDNNERYALNVAHWLAGQGACN